MKTALRFTGLFILAFILMHSPVVVAQYKPFSPTFGTDAVIYDDANCTFASSEIAVAGNGYIYVLGRLTIPGYRMYSIWRSVDEGLTFELIREVSNATADWTLPDVDFVVTGDDPGNINIWLAMIFNIHSGGLNQSYCQIEMCDADGEAIDVRYSKVWEGPSNSPYDVAIATDYRSPGYGSATYSIAIACTGHQDVNDFIIYVYSLDGGETWAEDELWNQVGENVFGKVSLSLGATQHYDQGYYGIAFECNRTGDLGDIGVIMNHTNNEGAWTTPVYVNQKVPSVTGKACYPSIALMDNTLANPANPAFFPVIIAYEDYGSSPEGANIMYNSLYDSYIMDTQATLENFSAYGIGLSNSENELEPDVCFDKTYNNFLMTYFTSEGYNMPYIWASMENIISGGWNTGAYYRDASTDIWGVSPKLDINPVKANACFSWTEQDLDDGHRSIFFDAEWSTVGIDNPAISTATFSLYPNPAYDEVVVNITKPGNYDVTVSNLTGKVIIKQHVDERTNVLNLGGLNAGVYFVMVSGEGIRDTQKLIVR